MRIGIIAPVLDYQSTADARAPGGRHVARIAGRFVAVAAVTGSCAMLGAHLGRSNDAWTQPVTPVSLLTCVICFVAFVVSVVSLFQSRGRRGWIPLALSIGIAWIAMGMMMRMILSTMST